MVTVCKSESTRLPSRVAGTLGNVGLIPWNLARRLTNAHNLLLRDPLYPAPMRLPSETRFVPVENDIVFYTVLEPEHIVEIRRVLYGRVDLHKQPL